MNAATTSVHPVPEAKGSSWRGFIALFAHNHGGNLLFIGNFASERVIEAPVHYAAAKAALKGFTEALAKEVGRYGITVNCLAPGILEEGVSRNLPQARMDEYLRHCALGRTGRFEEVAEVAAFLACDANSYMNGATVIVDGAV